MEKAGVRTRDIQFFSEKNQKIICTHSRKARDFARWLEQQSWVVGYETCVPLEQDRFQHINPIDIRKEYLQIPWTTDFLIHQANRCSVVREFIDEKDFSKKSVIEKLELSRRYWAVLDVTDWKLIIAGEVIKGLGGIS